MRRIAVVALVAACGKEEAAPPPRAEAARDAGVVIAPVVVAAVVAPDAAPVAAPVAAAPDASPKATPRVRDDQAVMLEEEAARFAAMLTAEGEDVGGEPARRPGADLEAQLADVRESGAAVAIGGGGGGGAVRVGASEPVEPKVRVAFDLAEEGDDPLYAQEVLGAARARYTPGIARCFRKASFRGASTIAIVIAETGVARPTVGDFGDATSCIAGQAKNWRFGRPESAAEIVLRVTTYEP